MAKVELKQPIVDEISGVINGAQSVVVVDYLGLTVAEDTQLRKQLREAGVTYKVYKNTLVNRAIQGTEFEGLKDVLEGPSAFAVSTEDATAPARILAKFAKTAPALEIKAGVVEGTFYDAEGMKAIAAVPSRDELLGKLLGSIQSPITNLARVLNQIAEQGGAADAAVEAAPAEDATEEDITPEMLEPLVRDCLKDVLFHSEDGKLYAFAWNRTDAFELAESKTDLIIGSDVRFDILEYTSQETTDPDPVMAMNKFVKELYPECIVVGLDRMEEITEASRETPVIYCRLNSMEKVEETNTVVWMDGKLAIHILCPDTDMRLKMAAAITNAMSLDGEVTMLDLSLIHI